MRPSFETRRIADGIVLAADSAATFLIPGVRF